MGKIYFVRHGQTVWNVENLITDINNGDGSQYENRPMYIP